MNKEITLPDGTVWPRPYTRDSEPNSPEWKARWAQHLIAPEDLYWLAWVAETYSSLVLTPKQAKQLPQLRREIDNA